MSKQVSWDPSITFTISNPYPSLCLNMIVKNEGKIITRLLDSVSTIIDSYCICDTGSTDDTVEIITEFFKKRGIPGKVVQEPFKDFGYNRTFALNACKNLPNADYLLLLDADMIFQLNPQVSPTDFKKMLKEEAYYIFQGTNHHFYKNTRIVKNNKGITYWGVTHEYVNLPSGCNQSIIDRSVVFINDVGDGGSKANKFTRDIELLKNGLIEIPNNDRYTFYLANTYHDSGQHDLAIETYTKRIQIGGWIEEIWYSYYRIGKCYYHKGEHDKAIIAWMEGYNAYPNRIENLYEIVKHYRCNGKNTLAYGFYLLANKSMQTYPSRDFLFTENDVYEYKLDYEFTIIGYYVNTEKYDILKYCMQVLKHSIDDGITKNLMSNYKFYAQKLITHNNNSINVDALKSIGSNFTDELQGFNSSTPSFCIDTTTGNIIAKVRYVNYRIDENGGYVNQSHITTKNIISTLRFNDSKNTLEKIGTDFILDYNKTLDNVYVGLEDIRLFESNGIIYYNCNRGISHRHIQIEHGQISLTDKTTVNSVLLTKPGSSEVEKNWVLVDKKGDDLYCIYKWHPLTLGKITKTQPSDDHPSLFETISQQNTPKGFKQLRGSTNGVKIGNEIWFLCHAVSYEDRRYYYQTFVVLDANTYEFKTYMPWFTFEGAKVEYCLGFIYLEASNQLLIGYSIMDCETKYMTVDVNVLKEKMLQ